MFPIILVLWDPGNASSHCHQSQAISRYLPGVRCKNQGPDSLLIVFIKGGGQESVKSTQFLFMFFQKFTNFLTNLVGNKNILLVMFSNRWQCGTVVGHNNKDCNAAAAAFFSFKSFIYLRERQRERA